MLFAAINTSDMATYILFFVVGFIACLLTIAPKVIFRGNLHGPKKIRKAGNEKAKHIGIEIGTFNLGFGAIERETESEREVIYLVPFASYTVTYNKA